MGNMTLQRRSAQALLFGLNTMLAQIIARLRPTATTPLHPVTATIVAEPSTTVVAEPAAPVRPVSRGTTHPYPQRWTPVRPGMRADAAIRLEYPYGSAARVVLRPDAASHLR